MGTLFSKQDTYKLDKFGFSYGRGIPEALDLPRIRAGSEVPVTVQAAGTRICLVADKIAQMISQSLTAKLRDHSRVLETQMTSP